MGLRDTKDLKKFLKPFPAEKQALVFWLREFAWKLYPKANELIYDNYNAVAFGWSLSDKVQDLFCSIAVGRSTENVHFGFYWGSKIKDPKGILLGEGNQYRYILVASKAGFPAAYMKSLLRQAYRYSEAKMNPRDEVFEGMTIMKSISAKKRPKPKKK